MKKIILIGDSIRQGYDRYVKMALEGVAQVYYTDDNCRFTTYILRELYDWKNKWGCGDDVDLIHWNAGLWDCFTLFDGETLLPLEDYVRNLHRICRMMKALYPNAKMIFATSTPVRELYKVQIRRNCDIEAYNAVAVKVVKEYGAEINDLYGLMKDTPESYHSDFTHYYTKEATELITNQVLSKIENALDIQAKPLDYEELFRKKEDVIGM